MLGATAISLFPDWTVGIQGLIFLAVFAVVSRLIVQPLVRLRDLRRQATVATEAEAQELAELAKVRLEEYERRLQAARQEGAVLRENLRQEGFARASAIIKDARQQALARLDAAKTKMEIEAAAARKLLEGNAEQFGRAIAERILERVLTTQRASRAERQEAGGERSSPGK